VSSRSLPSRIGRYEILDRLGKGGMGVLYLARDPLLRRTLAIKVLAVDDDDLRERFAREARSAASLNHLNIVTIFDVGEDAGYPFLAMEYLDGETMAELIRRKAPMTLQRRLQLLLELCAGLGYAHRLGVVHRDIKPANLMITGAGILKILDFGLARLTHDTTAGLTQSGALLGTPNYMSPEQVEGRPIDQRTDIFSVGLVLYELLTYKKAYSGDGLHVILHKITHQRPQPLRELDPAIDPALELIVENAIAPDPDQRYQSLELMAADTSAFLKALAGRPDADATVIVRRSDPSDGATTKSDAESGGIRPTPPTPKVPNFEGIARRRQAQIQLHIDEASRHFREGHYEQSIEQCELAAVLNPEDSRALELLSRAHAALEDQEIAGWLSEAQTSLAEGALSRAEQLIQRSLERRPGHENAQALRRQVQDARRELERRREKERAVAAALERARGRLAEGAFEAVVRAASEALAFDPDNAEAQALKQQALDALEIRRREIEDEQRATNAVAAARGAARAGDLEGAAALLDGFAPPHALIIAARAEIQSQLDARERLLAHASAAKAAARAAIEAGEWDAARSALQEAASAVPKDPELPGLRGALANRRAEAEAAAKRQAALQQHVSDAGRLLADGDLVASIRAADLALALDPSDRAAQVVRSKAAEAVAEREAAEARAAAEKAREQAEREARERAQAEERAREQAAREAAEREAAERAAREAAERAARETAEREHREAEQAKREAAERAAREAAERGARETAERERREAEQAKREAAERAAREAAEREARETAERERREAERAKREAAERAAREAAEREARETAEREQREAAERVKRDAAERAARKAAEREARETAEREQRDAAERVKRDAAERAAREAAEREARETAERERRDAAKRAKREAAEKAKREAGERAAREAAERETRETAERERLASEQVERVRQAYEKGGRTQPPVPETDRLRVTETEIGRREVVPPATIASTPVLTRRRPRAAVPLRLVATIVAVGLIAAAVVFLVLRQRPQVPVPIPTTSGPIQTAADKLQEVRRLTSEGHADRALQVAVDGYRDLHDQQLLEFVNQTRATAAKNAQQAQAEVAGTDAANRREYVDAIAKVQQAAALTSVEDAPRAVALYAAAERDYRAAVTASSTDPAVFVRRATDAYKSGAVDRAVEYALTARRLDPAHTAADRIIDQIRRETARETERTRTAAVAAGAGGTDAFGKAEQRAKEAARATAPDDLSIQVTANRAAAQLYRGAAAAAESARAERHATAEQHVAQARTYLSQKRLEDADTELRQATALEPQNAGAQAIAKQLADARLAARIASLLEQARGVDARQAVPLLEQAAGLDPSRQDVKGELKRRQDELTAASLVVAKPNERPSGRGTLPSGRETAPSEESERVAAAAAIHQVLDRYKSAWEALDVDAVQAVYPGVNAKALRESFKGVKKQPMTLQAQPPDIDPGRTSATVRGHIASRIDVQVGSAKRLDSDVVFHFTKSASGEWLINKIEYR
jgi:serine/threonine-protein kinase